MNVKKGDLIRVKDDTIPVTAYKAGGIYEVLGIVGEDDDVQVEVSGEHGIRGYLDEDEFEFYGRAGELKAEKGDLIRIVNAVSTGGKYKNGDIVEVVGRWCNGVLIDITDMWGDAVDIYDREYVIHRKAGEEDSEAYCDNCGLEEVNGDCAHCSEEYEPSKWSDTQPNLIRLAGEELTELLVRKNHDYGDSFSQQYAKYGALSAMIRMDDKMRRLETLIGGEQAHVDESLADTLLDLAGYALLAYVETRKE